jgi:hypothetical protein
MGLGDSRLAGRHELFVVHPRQLHHGADDVLLRRAAGYIARLGGVDHLAAQRHEIDVDIGAGPRDVHIHVRVLDRRHQRPGLHRDIRRHGVEGAFGQCRAQRTLAAAGNALADAEHHGAARALRVGHPGRQLRLELWSGQCRRGERPRVSGAIQPFVGGQPRIGGNRFLDRLPQLEEAWLRRQHVVRLPERRCREKKK